MDATLALHRLMFDPLRSCTLCGGGLPAAQATYLLTVAGVTLAGALCHRCREWDPHCNAGEALLQQRYTRYQKERADGHS